MPDTAEKIRETDLEHDAIERWLREDVVEICRAIVADASTCIPIDQAFEDIKSGLKARYAD